MGKTSKIVWNDKLVVSGHRLNVTCRFDEGLLAQAHNESTGTVDDAKLLNLIYKLIHVTVSKWLVVAAAVNQYQTDKTKPDPETFDKSAESELFDPPIFADEPIVTVWSFDSPLTLHSHSSPYTAFIVWCAGDAYKANNEDARRVPAQKAPAQIAPEAAPPVQASGGFELPAGAIWGTSTDSRQVNYADKQLVAFAVTEVGFEAVGEDNIPAWKLHTPHGNLTVFVNTKAGGETYDYKALKGYFPQLGITMERPLAVGQWVVLVKAAHSGEREYLNFKKLFDIYDAPGAAYEEDEPEDRGLLHYEAQDML